MKILDRNELNGLLAQGRTAPERAITEMLDEFETRHRTAYRVIYGEPSDAIASINTEMANLYLDLACDVVWVFYRAFGRPPEIHNEEGWVLEKLSLIDAELKSLTAEVPMNKRFRDKLQGRFAKRARNTHVQLELLKYLEEEVARYSSFKKQRAQAVHLTNNLLFVLVRLMGDLYHAGAAKTA
jgi:hypothetical protein